MWTHWGVLTVSVKAQCSIEVLTGARHFSCKLLREMVLVKYPCAFRLRRLAQNVGPEIGVRHVSCKLPHKMALVKCQCAFRLRKLVPNAVCGKRDAHVCVCVLLCALICVLLCAPLCFYMFALLSCFYVLSYVSHVCALMILSQPLVSYHFASPHCLGSPG